MWLGYTKSNYIKNDSHIKLNPKSGFRSEMLFKLAIDSIHFIIWFQTIYELHRVQRLMLSKGAKRWIWDDNDDFRNITKKYPDRHKKISIIDICYTNMATITKTFLYFMNEKFNTNAKVEKFTNMTGIAVRLIAIDPFVPKCLWCRNI